MCDQQSLGTVDDFAKVAHISTRTAYRVLSELDRGVYKIRHSVRVDVREALEALRQEPERS